MKKLINSIPISFCFIILVSCIKKENSSGDCLPDVPVFRRVNNQQAEVRESNGTFFIVEQGTIDSRLLPCNLTREFQINNLSVIISGDVKLTTHNAAEPCCTESFVITDISK
ncbi:MAG: hypothetical protein ABI761_00905 [Saprospiraceae bacterium]